MTCCQGLLTIRAHELVLSLAVILPNCCYQHMLPSSLTWHVLSIACEQQRVTLICSGTIISLVHPIGCQQNIDLLVQCQILFSETAPYLYSCGISILVLSFGHVACRQCTGIPNQGLILQSTQQISTSFLRNVLQCLLELCTAVLQRSLLLVHRFVDDLFVLDLLDIESYMYLEKDFLWWHIP